MKNKFLKKLFVTFIVSISLSTGLIILNNFDILKSFHLEFSDKFQGNGKINENIIIIGIDTKTMNAVKEKANLMQGYFKLLENLSLAKVIGFDWMMEDTQNISKNELTKILDNKSKINVIDKLKPYISSPTLEQQKLADKIKILPIVLSRYDIIGDHEINIKDGFINTENKTKIESFYLYSNNANKLGNIFSQTDIDDTVRRFYLGAKDTDNLYESFSIAIARIFLDLNQEQGVFDLQNQIYKLSQNSKIQIPIDKDGQFKINFFNKPLSYTYFSFVDVMEGKISENTFKNKIVLIGPVAESLHDYQYVPTSNGIPMPGVEIHANAIQTIIENAFLKDQTGIAQALTVFVIAFISAFVVMYFGILTSVLYIILASIGYTLAAKFSFNHGIILNMVYPYLTIFLSFIIVYLYRYFTEIKAKKQLQSAFSKYVNKDIVKQISENPDLVTLGGEQKEITVFFSDIINFTHLSEGMTPKALVEFLNEYFEIMWDVIMKNHGTLDKYEGDAIMAFWGAPIDLKDHAYLACKAALEGREALKILHEKWKQENKPLIDYRVGLNTGLAIIGNVGSQERFDYTAMGDNVNLGSRLEAINNLDGTRICISEMTYEKIKDKFLTRKLDRIQVKGKDIPITIYELISIHKESDQKPTLYERELANSFELALNLYMQKNFEKALEAFNQILQNYPEDNPSKIYIDRCQEFIKNPPKDDWNGVWVYQTK
jgi:adenylate cyclase